MKLASSLLLALAFLTLPGSSQDMAVPVPALETLKKEYALRVKTADGQHLGAPSENGSRSSRVLTPATNSNQRGFPYFRRRAMKPMRPRPASIMA